MHGRRSRIVRRHYINYHLICFLNIDDAQLAFVAMRFRPAVECNRASEIEMYLSRREIIARPHLSQIHASNTFEKNAFMAMMKRSQNADRKRAIFDHQLRRAKYHDCHLILAARSSISAILLLASLKYFSSASRSILGRS